jgi:hypothetical protein
MTYIVGCSGLCYDPVSVIYRPVTLDVMLTHKWWFGSKRNRSTISALAWRVSGKLRKPLTCITGALAEIWTEHLPNKSLCDTCHRFLYRQTDHIRLWHYHGSSPYTEHLYCVSLLSFPCEVYIDHVGLKIQFLYGPCGPGTRFQLVNLLGCGISSSNDRYLHKQNKITQTSMPRVGFETTIPVFGRA